ncbi:MAG: protein phosphatase 2C domain-containing protein [Clostridiales bacterium]|nr:protein phosphatase 2C domain-containing protein [Clostridiales bacterium]
MGKNTLPALKLSFSAGKEPNEDIALCLRHEGVRLLAAFDGCGGVGGRRYAQLDNRTGAHIASGLYAGCLEEWFGENAAALPRENTAEDLSALFARTAREFSARYLKQPSAVTGSMVRTLPSTAAIALVYPQGAALYWAGNTRGYMLTDRGLRQLTRDDYATKCDAFESLYLDAPIANYLCADQPFGLHETAADLPQKGVLVLATDGAYHALPTPMHFEALLLDALFQSSTKKQWKKRLKESLFTRAADDVTLVLQPFGFRDYAGLNPYFDKRRRHVNQAYILPADKAEADNRLVLKALWEMYQKE